MAVACNVYEMISGIKIPPALVNLNYYDHTYQDKT